MEACLGWGRLKVGRQYERPPEHAGDLIATKELAGQWIAWRSLRGGRWSTAHFTPDGLKTICGKSAPSRGEDYHHESPSKRDRCPKCANAYFIACRPPGATWLDIADGAAVQGVADLD
jgi:hypothetical protein